MHTHHSHSGDYVAHAADTLEGVTGKALEMGFETFCMTEHMPRLQNKFIYPEESELNYTIESMEQLFDRYYTHARQIQKQNLARGSQTRFLVGFEVEGINDEHIEYSAQLMKKYNGDMCVGSVHFVKEIPIDFDRPRWEQALAACHGSIRELFHEYFKLQYKVISRLKPMVVGHLDLVRLYARDDDFDETTGKAYKDIEIARDWPEVWAQVIANLEFVRGYGGLVELNSAAIRKGWSSPYPQLDLAQLVIKHCDARFCFSDDAHSIAQVGLNYHKVLEYAADALHLQRIYYLDYVKEGEVAVKTVGIEEVRRSAFWAQYY